MSEGNSPYDTDAKAGFSSGCTGSSLGSRGVIELGADA
jgi:hypothetical protein